MENSIYLILPCNKDNDTSLFTNLENFTTNLPKAFDLEGKWEIALTEISYPKTWYNIPFDQSFEFLVFNKDSPTLFDVISSEEVIIPKGFYHFEELADKINFLRKHLWTEVGDTLYIKGNINKQITSKPYIETERLNTDELNKTISKSILYQGVINRNERFFIRFSEVLGNILGLNNNNMTYWAFFEFTKYAKLLKENPNYSFQNVSTNADSLQIDSIKHHSSAFDYDNSIKQLFVTSDLVKNSIYGSKNTRLLRQINVPSNYKFGDQITEIFDNPYYYPLNNNLFNSVKIEIFNDLNYNNIELNEEKIKFLCGKIIITLHLRKIDKCIDNENTDKSIEFSTDEPEPMPNPNQKTAKTNINN